MRRVFKATMIVPLLFSSAIATIAVQAADDDVRLRGVTSVRYGSLEVSSYPCLIPPNMMHSKRPVSFSMNTVPVLKLNFT